MSAREQWFYDTYILPVFIKQYGREPLDDAEAWELVR